MPILSEMLSIVPDTIDKREGSIIYNTLAPVAITLAEQNFMLTYMFNLLFGDTAEGEWLDRVTSDFGVDREQSTKAIRQINTFNSGGVAVDIPIGSRFAIADITLVLTEKIAVGQYKAECEQYGTVGNQYSGEILPVDNINGLGSAVLVQEALIPARDTETDESLRERFYLSTRQVPFGGNIADYEKKTLEIDGVGAVKVFTAVSQGPGNIGLVIGDEQGNKATQTLVDAVQLLMGTTGCGIAPIGHIVTVKTCSDLAVNVIAPVSVKTGASFDIIKPIVEATIRSYIEDIKFTDQTIFYAKLVANILNSHESIVDVGNVTMNGVAGNLALAKTYATYQVPIVGSIAVSEVV